MPYYALFYQAVDDFIARRALFVTSIWVSHARRTLAASWCLPAPWPIRQTPLCSFSRATVLLVPNLLPAKIRT